MNHNDYLFCQSDGKFRFLRQFDQMYGNCDDPHGQSLELAQLGYKIVTLSLKHMLSVLQISDSGSLLDVGCGLGYFTGYLQEQLPGWRVSGADISAIALSKASKRIPLCRFFQLDLKDEATIPKEKFDVIISMNVLYYFTEEEIHEVVQNLRRLACEGGLLISGYHLPETMNFGRYIRSLDDARALLEPWGFKYVLGIDVNDQIGQTYAGTHVGRHIYFAFQSAGDDIPEK
jgi:SAM-dependent methyltransferase